MEELKIEIRNLLSTLRFTLLGVAICITISGFSALMNVFGAGSRQRTEVAIDGVVQTLDNFLDRHERVKSQLYLALAELKADMMAGRAEMRSLLPVPLPVIVANPIPVPVKLTEPLPIPVLPAPLPKEK